MPGCAIIEIVAVPSLNLGKKSRPIKDAKINEEINKPAVTPITSRGRLSAFFKSFVSQAFNVVTSFPSLWSIRLLLLSKYEHKAGVTVNEIIIDAKSETMYATPSGMNSLPSMPPIVNNGIKTRHTITVAMTIEFLTSLDASKMTLKVFLGDADCLFSRSLRNTFSTSTIASSTSSPMAMAKPPRVIVLTDNPKM